MRLTETLRRWSRWRCHARRDASAWPRPRPGGTRCACPGRRLVTDRHGPAATNRAISADMIGNLVGRMTAWGHAEPGDLRPAGPPAHVRICRIADVNNGATLTVRLVIRLVVGADVCREW